MTDPVTHRPYGSFTYGSGLYGIDFIGVPPATMTIADDVSCPPTTSIFDELFCGMKRFFGNLLRPQGSVISG